ncbi:hypothetical protein M2G39_22455 [Vibrio vulnificus]|nr:hypothetical protein [Vibrio vulnificus]MCU8474744.1 hypothetical protein [Vibrio vulnificus]
MIFGGEVVCGRLV